MPWRGPAEPGEFPTLGYLVADWIEDHCAIPDGDQAGDRYLLTAEMVRFLIWYYRLDPDTGRLHYERGGQLVRPQKWGKGPFSSAVICAEAAGPVVPAGWDSSGEPVGRPWATPWIQVTAVSEDQTDNVWRALQPMIELGEIAADIPDTGQTRINLAGGGRIEPVTSSAKSRLGQRITFAVQDETHSWTALNGGRKLADNQRRNLAGMGGRWLETTNAWDPAEESVAQATFESTAPGVYLDDVDPGPGSIRNKRDRRRMFRKVYGDSTWVDLDRIDAEAVALIDQGDAGQAERFFANRKRAAEGTAFDADRWAQLADPARVVADGELITVGVDGARWDDALAMIATHVETGHQWPLGIWERPRNAPADYEHPEAEIDGVLVDAFERFTVTRVYVDPQKIEHLVDRWRGRWNQTDDRQKQRIVEWWTNRPKPIGYAVRAYTAAQTAGDVSHDGDRTFALHIAHARKQPLLVKDDERRPLHTLCKDRKGSQNKIDAAMAAVLSWEARGDAIAAGVLATPPPKQMAIW
ncbi:MAG TPA: hypothetical protein VHL53_19505 [Acidimicrobiia bacterium]|nr:hypothetical protein [Acidimicrobiia bacterium]